MDPWNVIDCEDMGLEIEQQNQSFGKLAKGIGAVKWACILEIKS